MWGGVFLSVPLLLSTNHTNNQIVSNNLDYKNIINQDNNKSTGSSDFSSQPAEIQDFFSVYVNKKIYTNSDSQSLFAVVTQDNGFDVLYAWGWNIYGQLGLAINDKTNRSFPTLVPGLPPNSNITHVVSSIRATTVVVNGDQIWTTGANSHNEHGDPDLGNKQTFVQNTKWEGGIVKSIHAGAEHRVVVTADDVWVWGFNRYGELGKGNMYSQKSPLTITDKIIAANPDWATGEFYVNSNNTAMLVNGQLYIWGNNSSGALGIDNEDHVMTPPNTPINFNGKKIKKYSLGDLHSIVLLENGELYSWGSNFQGQLGINSDTNPLLIPTKVTTMLGGAPISGVTDVFTVGSTSYIQIGNKIYSCGNNDSGLLAQGPTIDNNKIFSPVILEPSAVIKSIYTTQTNLVINLNTGLHMAGSNRYGQFANGIVNTNNNDTLTQVSPFGDIKLETKSDNTNYTASGVVDDLKKQTTTEDIRSSLTKYVDGIDSIPLESTLSYQVLPVGSDDGTKVTLTLKTNRSFDPNNAKISGDFSFPVTITNLGHEESSIIIKNKPTGVHTGNIRTKLNPNTGSFPSELWEQIVDMTKFPNGTTFTSVTDDNVTVGTGTDGTYAGNIVASNYYVLSGPTGTPKSFPFVINGLTKVADSKFAANQPIHENLNMNSYGAELQIGQAIKPEYLDMFVEKDTFPDDTTFTIVSRRGYDDSKTLSCDISYDKHYKDGFLKTSGTKSFTFNNFKTIENSEIVFTGYGDTGIHSGNISEKLINADKTVNIDILKKLVFLQKFPTEDTKFTIKGEPNLDISNKIYSVNMVADLAYEKWVQVPNKEFTIEFTGITIVEDSKTASSAIYPDLNIDNIKTELPDGQPIKDKYLSMFVEEGTFPDDTIFTIDNSKVDTTNKTFSCDVLYNKYYEGGFLKTNGTKNFTFNDFKTIRESGIDFKSFEGTDINSANIDEKLITDGTVNEDVLRQIAELKGFAADTIFTIKGKPTLNINTRTYSGIMIASQAYVNWVQVPNKEFAFEFTGITVVADSKTTSATIHPDLNIDNIKIELPNGQPIKDKYLSMFVEKGTFPTGTIFKIDRVIVDEENKTFSCDVLYDKYYKDGLLKTNGEKSLTFNDFKTIEISEINFKSFEGSGIHSANIEEKLITNGIVNKDVLSQIAELKGFFTETIFTIKGTPTLNVNAGTYSGTITASKSYKDWSVVTSSEDFAFTFVGLQKIGNSEVVNKNLPSGYHINNIETQLTTGESKIIKKHILNKFIDIDKFPTNATFTMGVAKKDEPNNKFTFDIIPSHHYIDGIATINNTTPQTKYTVTIQFKELPPAPIPTPIFAPEESNLGLIIGLSVGGAALIGIIAFGIWWKLKH